MFFNRRLLRQIQKEQKEMTNNVQASIDEMKSAFADLKSTISEALNRLDTRVDQAPEAADDVDEIAAIASDVKGTTQSIRDALNKPVFSKSGN